MDDGDRVLGAPMACALCGAAEAEPLSYHRDFEGSAVVCCRGCGFISTRPVPSSEVLEAFYRTSYSEDRSRRPAQAEVFDSRARAQASMIHRNLGPQSGRRALEIGCGTGRLLVALHERGFDVHGFEPDPIAAEAARSAVGIADAVETGMADLPSLERRAYDIVALSHVLEHLADPVLAIEQLLGALKPSGLLFLEVPNSTRRYVRRLLRRAVSGTGHLHFFTPRTLAAAVTAAGGSIVEVVTVGPDIETTPTPYGPPASLRERLQQLGERALMKLLARTGARRSVDPFTVEQQAWERGSDDGGRYVRLVAAVATPSRAASDLTKG